MHLRLYFLNISQISVGTCYLLSCSSPWFVCQHSVNQLSIKIIKGHIAFGIISIYHSLCRPTCCERKNPTSSTFCLLHKFANSCSHMNTVQVSIQLNLTSIQSNLSPFSLTGTLPHWKKKTLTWPHMLTIYTSYV